MLLALYRFIQEGATNILKHSGARNSKLLISFEEDSVWAELSDDGCGFASPAMGEKSPASGAYGLSGLADRIALVRGEFTVDSIPGLGTTLKVTMPRDPVSRIGKDSGADER